MTTDTAPRADVWSARGLPLALLMAFLTTAAIAVPYWTRSYAAIREDGIFGSFLMVELALFLGTFLAGTVSEAPLWVVVTIMVAPTPIAVLGRIILDSATDPASHNLWPLEIVLSGVISVPPVCLGAVVAWGVRRLSPGSR